MMYKLEREMRRTKWPATKFEDREKVVRQLMEYLDTEELLVTNERAELLRQLKCAGYTKKWILELQHEAILRSNWSDDKYVAARVEATGVRPEQTDEGFQRQWVEKEKKLIKGQPITRNCCDICDLPCGAKHKRNAHLWGVIELKVCWPCKRLLISAKIRGHKKK